MSQDTQTPTGGPGPGNAPGDGDRLDAAVLKIAGVVVLGAIMSILDITVVSVALPTFQNEFDATYAQVAWTMTAYTLALATVIPLTGWAADRFGTKRLYMMALVLFTAGSVLCSLAGGITELVVFRVIQGLGGGMLMPLGMTIMTRAAGPHRIGRVMAVLGIPMLLGPIGGPILGGWLIESLTWHWIFLINLPIGIVALFYAWRVLPKDNPQPSQSFDWTGMILLSPGLALFLFGVSSIPEEGTVWASKVLVTAAVGVVLIVAFVFHAFRPEHPLVDLRLFKHRNLTVAVITMACFAIAFFGASILFAAYFLQVRGESTLVAGLLLAPQGLGAMLTMPVGGALVDRIGPGKVVLTGLALTTAGMAGFTQVGADTSYPFLLSALFVMGLGMGLTMMPTMTAALATLTEHTIARGSTLMNIIQQVAASIGTAVFSVVLTNQLTGGTTVAEATGAPVTKETDVPLSGLAIESWDDPSLLETIPAALIRQGFGEAADAFGTSFVLATVLIGLTLVPAFFLPRRRIERVGEDSRTPVVVH
ncbi:DHA2 family efflux MFS transporter permease subunit [Mumia sp. zg.B17]|uniref:DHA2 family efflux MFS transporter permease subunit n=1 Tax=unclassified Mumia TaxID=2621872 RepID=UPI001C6E9952|nr:MULTISPECIES: DHA2 family efflux MFS transporter permease subunit [unclassified Mumia]MBW9206762.1 DHA2 family efflux MFS transporter permease subunit [Mumia sp. zg.B17]MBW9210951.1 DHA2 family efflux MFS transporter permease subunit [Mumia sp. zg.B21]MDD9347276.1 DHA2 family efflux MFS transporter permease subunit [Mumia sp.]